MVYRVPRADIDFVLHHLADINSVLQLPNNEELSLDLISAVLDESTRLVEEVVAPLNAVADHQGAQWQNGKVTTTPGYKAAFEAYTQGGWQGLLHDSLYGGQELPKTLGAVVSENLNAACLAFALCPLLTDGVIEALTIVGTPAQQKTYIPPLIEGRWTGTMNLTEPQAGSDLALISTRAEPQKDGSYRIKGQKIFITYGEHDLAENILHLVLARTPDAPKGVKGLSLFLVPKYLVDNDGSLAERNDVWCASLEHKLGIHGSPTAVLLYGSGQGEVGEHGAVGYLIGEVNLGLQYMFIMMNAARYAVGIQGVAVAERALQLAKSYAHERVQGQDVESGVAPIAIAKHPDVDRMLKTMQGLTEGSRALAYWAAVANDVSEEHSDAEIRYQAKALYEFLVPVVKAFATEMSQEVCSLGVQVHGGMGYIEETGAAQLYRDARILTIYEGTTAIQANDFVARKVLRDGAKVARSLAKSMHETVAELRARVLSSAHTEGLTLIADALEQAVQAYERAIDFGLAHAKQHIKAVFYGSVPLLMLTGTVLSGWQLARAALVCDEGSSGQSDQFNRQKIETAVFYAAFLLPRTAAYVDAIEAGLVLELYNS